MYAQGGVDGRVWFRVWGWRGPPSTGLNVAAAEWGPGLTLLLQLWTPGGGEGQGIFPGGVGDGDILCKGHIPGIQHIPRVTVAVTLEL